MNKSPKMTFVTALLATAVVYAQTKPVQSTNSTEQNRGSDKVDLKKLEDKYWSAKDDDYGVIQNRTFSKASKPYVSLVYGPLLNDPFAKSRAMGAMLGYYFTEDFGIEAHYFSYDSKSSESVEGFNSLSSAGVSPNYNLIKSAYALSMTYTPFYAKMSFMNSAILYFDMGLTVGAGMTTYDQMVKILDNLGNDLGEKRWKKTTPHFEIGVMQQLFINKNVAFRMDIKNTFNSKKVVPYNVGTTGDQYNRTETTKSANDTTITLGLTLFTN